MALEVVWHSYDISTASGSQPVTLFDERKILPVSIEFYVSSNDFGVTKGNLLDVYNPGQHWDGFNKVEDFWSFSSGWGAYPYAGKSRISRGRDSDETNTPEPQGVYDLQFHPPESNKLIVCSFLIPADGYYEISDLAVRRVYNEGDIVRYYILDSSEKLILHLAALNDQKWVSNSVSFSLGPKIAGNRIYFPMGRGENDNYYWDAAELTWTVKKLDPENEIITDDYVLFQNYPNPFNRSTIIKYAIPAEGRVRITIYDILGRKIRTFVDQNQGPGINYVYWDAYNDQDMIVSNGVYIYTLETAGFKAAKKMVLLR